MIDPCSQEKAGIVSGDDGNQRGNAGICLRAALRVEHPVAGPCCRDHKTIILVENYDLEKIHRHVVRFGRRELPFACLLIELRILHSSLASLRHWAQNAQGCRAPEVIGATATA